MRPLSIALAVLACALIVGACDGGGADPSPEPTTQAPVETATGVSASPTPGGTAESARSLDFTDPAVVGPLIDHFGGGEVPPERVEYVDVTADGVEEAIVFVESGGTQGDLGAAVLQAVDGSPAVLGYVESGGRVETRLTEVGGGVIASLEGVYQPGDPECCPSQLHERVYEWDGSAFVVVIDQVIAAPRSEDAPTAGAPTGDDY